MSEAEVGQPKGMARLRQFPRAFWVINGIELLERGAYYSLSAVLTVFMIQTFVADGMTTPDAASLAGTLGATLFLLLYIIPVVAAPFSEKYGYRASLAVVFALLAGGYALTFFATGLPLIVASVLLIGLGAGIFKPIPAALVTRTTAEDQRNFGFSIYYACINVGALVFPGLLGILAAVNGWSAEQLFRTTFLTSAALSGVNLLLSLFVFRNVAEPRRDVNVLASIKMLGDVFRYPTFLALMVIYSGFWFMYVLSLTFLGVYMEQFGRMPEWFNVSLLMTINPAVIILGAPLLAPLGRRFNPVPLMITGILLYAIGLVTLGFSATSTLFLLGVVMFSLGELFTHPAYLSYVSRIAPPEKASVFLGYGFIPIGVGQFVGAKLGGDLYGRIALTDGRPEMYWAIMASVGLVTAALLLVYNIVVSRKAQPDDGRRRSPLGFLAGPSLAALIILLVPGLVFAGSVIPARDADGLDRASLDPSQTSLLNFGELAGELEEATNASKTFTAPDALAGAVTLNLTWQDESPSGASAYNAPDTFRLILTRPDGTQEMSPEVANEPGAEGRISLVVDGLDPEDVFEVTVEIVDAGDVTTQAGPLGPLALPGGVGGSPDTGNAFTLTMSAEVAATE